MTGTDPADRIREVQDAIGTLPRTIRALLLTDGSVTTLLEAITDDTVQVRTLVQEVVPASESQALDLGVEPGEPVNHRVVELYTAGPGNVLVYAISDTPLARLDPGFRNDLMRADIPIGKILRFHRLETRREIAAIRLLAEDPSLARVFRIPASEPLISRKYHIIHREKTLISIEEIFPARRVPGTAGMRIPPARIGIVCPARLHLGLIDLCGELGRVDGGIGIAIAEPSLRITAEVCDGIEVSAPDPGIAEKIRAAAEKTVRHFGIAGGARIAVLEKTPVHAGLGSGTQAGLAAARAVCTLHGMDAPARELAALVGRGGTSGIGTAAFAEGGFIVDGGHRFGGTGGKHGFLPSSASADIMPAAVTFRQDFPVEWNILVVIPGCGRRVSGAQELDHFMKYCPLPIEEVREVCHELVVRILPGVIERDLSLFSAGVNRLSGIGFKKAEISLQDPVIPGLIDALRGAGAPCSGMSSFGPAVYAITDADTAGLEQAAREYLGECAATMIRTKGMNHGAVVREYSANGS